MKKKVILSSMLTIALCLSLIAGSTFALFTSESELNIEVNAGKVELIASVENIETWSLEDDKTAAGHTGGNFSQGGSAKFANSILTLDKIIPGDKVAFNITGENNSNVTLQYRVKIACTEGKELMSGLKVTIGTETVTGLVSYVSPWETLAVGADMTAVKVAIELPEDAGDEYQGKSAKISVLVEAIQGNAETFNDAKAGTVVATETNAAGELVTAAKTVISSNGFSANIPAGTVLNAGSTTATLTVTKEEASTGSSNFEAVGAETIGLNISIPEVAPDNDTPIIITIEDILGTGLTGVMLYHKDVPMTPVGSAAEVDADGEFFYDAATGKITLATVNFSNFTAVVLNSVEVADEAALTAAITNGKNVTLTADITLTKTLEIKKNVIIDLNGYTVSATLPSSAYHLFQSYSGPKPSVLITSFKDGAEINAGDHSVILGYGSTEINNVEINVGTVKDSNHAPFKVPGSLTLGEGTVVNVEYLGTSLITNGPSAIVIDGAQINVEEFKVYGGAMISINAATTVELNNTKVNVGLNTTYTSYFISKAENVTVYNCAFNVKSLDGFSYVVTETYGWAVDSVEVADEAALTAAITNGKNVTLTADITLTKTLAIKKNVIIDLNGYTVSATLPSSAYHLFQSYSGPKPSVLITSSKEDAKINAGDYSVIMGYGSTEINNVEINVGTVKDSNHAPFKVPGSLTLGEGTVVNVEYLGTSLITNGPSAIVIDGAQINVGTFRVSGGSMISLNNATTVELSNAKVNVGLDTTYTSYFINKAENVTVAGCTFDVTDLEGASYIVTDTYGWEKI